MSKIKQVIVMRKDLGMRKGKMCAQAAHASMKNAMFNMHLFMYNNTGKKVYGYKKINWIKFITLKISLKMFSWVTGISINDNFIYRFYDAKKSYIGQWLDDVFTKVVVGVDCEEDLLRINKEVYKYNQSMGLVRGDDDYIACEIITDSGATEFHGVPTNTCLAIGPAPDYIIDKFTGNLKLL